MNRVTRLLSSAGVSIFNQKSAIFVLSRNTDTYCIFIHNKILSAFF